MSTYSLGGYADAGLVDMVRAAVATGANQVVFGNVVLADLATGAIGAIRENGVAQTASLAEIEGAVRQAHAAGLTVLLKPQIAVHDAAFDKYNSASWINMVNPDLVIANPSAFFANYKAHLLAYAAIAERQGVEALSIGNEMVAATKSQYTGYWLDIIAAVRAVYSGDLTYAALVPVLTDAASNEVTQIGFWNKLDFAGFDVYPSLVKGSSPTVAELKAGWHDAVVYGHRQDYAAFVSKLAAGVGKPVVFVETGLPSFDGASDREATSDGNIGSARAADQQEQADWWQAFFETWAVHPPTWLAGVIVNNNDPAKLGSYYDQNYNIDGKLAEGVVTAWFGGAITIEPTAESVRGSQADDDLFLYGIGAAGTPGSLAQSLSTTLSVTLTGSILGGTAPSIRFRVNGRDFPAVALAAVDSGYVNADGVHYSANQSFSVTLPGLVAIGQFEILFDGPLFVGGRRASTFFHAVEINGVAVERGSYTPDPSQGTTGAVTLPHAGVAGTAGHWGGGVLTLDAAPWNSVLAARTTGSAANPIEVYGSGGVDSVHVLGDPRHYSITRTGGARVALSESDGLGQNAVLDHIATIVFGNGTTVALSDIAAGRVYGFGGADGNQLQIIGGDAPPPTPQPQPAPQPQPPPAPQPQPAPLPQPAAGASGTSLPAEPAPSGVAPVQPTLPPLGRPIWFMAAGDPEVHAVRDLKAAFHGNEVVVREGFADLVIGPLSGRIEGDAGGSHVIL